MANQINSYLNLTRIGSNVIEEIPPLSLQFPQLFNRLAGERLYPPRVSLLSRASAEPPLVLADPTEDPLPRITHLHQPLLISFNKVLVDLSSNDKISQMIDMCQAEIFSYLPALALYYYYSTQTKEKLIQEVGQETSDLIFNANAKVFKEQITQHLENIESNCEHSPLYLKMTEIWSRIGRLEQKELCMFSFSNRQKVIDQKERFDALPNDLLTQESRNKAWEILNEMMQTGIVYDLEPFLKESCLRALSEEQKKTFIIWLIRHGFAREGLALIQKYGNSYIKKTLLLNSYVQLSSVQLHFESSSQKKGAVYQAMAHSLILEREIVIGSKELCALVQKLIQANLCSGIQELLRLPSITDKLEQESWAKLLKSGAETGTSSTFLILLNYLPNPTPRSLIMDTWVCIGERMQNERIGADLGEYSNKFHMMYRKFGRTISVQDLLFLFIDRNLTAPLDCLLNSDPFKERIIPPDEMAALQRAASGLNFESLNELCSQFPELNNIYAKNLLLYILSIDPATADEKKLTRLLAIFKNHYAETLTLDDWFEALDTAASNLVSDLNNLFQIMPAETMTRPILEQFCLRQTRLLKTEPFKRALNSRPVKNVIFPNVNAALAFLNKPEIAQLRPKMLGAILEIATQNCPHLLVYNEILNKPHAKELTGESIEQILSLVDKNVDDRSLSLIHRLIDLPHADTLPIAILCRMYFYYSDFPTQRTRELSHHLLQKIEIALDKSQPLPEKTLWELFEKGCQQYFFSAVSPIERKISFDQVPIETIGTTLSSFASSGNILAIERLHSNCRHRLTPAHFESAIESAEKMEKYTTARHISNLMDQRPKRQKKENL